MGVKILVVGFPRSGTTLTHRICKRHPQVAGMFNEEHILRSRSSRRFQFVTADYLYKKYPRFKLNYGEKMIYEKDIVGKKKFSNITIVDYCKQWNKLFKKDARIVQIVRHPFDSWNSILKKKYIKRGEQSEIPRMLELYITYVPKYTEEIASLKNCLTIKYENLISNSEEVIRMIYNHCGLDSSHNFLERMRVSRVFNYRKRGFGLKRVDPRLAKVIETFNKFSGPKYHLGDLP